MIDLNDLALDHLQCIKRLSIVPRATHLFDEPGTLERVAELAGEWFEQYVATGALQAAPPMPSETG